MTDHGPITQCMGSQFRLVLGKRTDGENEILHFEEIIKIGGAPWIVAYHKDGSVTEINVAHVASISREGSA